MYCKFNYELPDIAQDFFDKVFNNLDHQVWQAYYSQIKYPISDFIDLNIK